MKKYGIIVVLLLSMTLLPRFNTTKVTSSQEEEILEIEITDDNHFNELRIGCNYDILDEGNTEFTQEQTKEQEEELSPIVTEVFDTDIIEYMIQYKEENVEEIPFDDIQVFQEKYTEMEGIITFRGNNLRNSASYGVSNIEEEKLEEIWDVTTSTSTWGGGAGWTGQPVIVRWSEEIKEIMNIEEEFKSQEGFTEVIYGSLGGKVYFIDLHTGKQSREPIYIKNPIKGSISIDPREYPLLYVGDGINESGKFGYRIFSLIDGEELYFINGIDSFAYRGWGAFDSSGIVNLNTDTLIEAGENGILHKIKLNTEFDIENKTLNISPEIIKYRYKIKGNSHQGIDRKSTRLNSSH